MRRLMGTALAAGTLAGALALAAGPAVAEERVCRGKIGATTVDNLRVPEGAVCRLRGTLVEGTITVQGDARLDARSIRVIGNVQGEGHRSVVLRRSRVGGSVQLVQGGAATVARTRIGGDLQSFENDRRQSFTRNRVDGNMQCKENAPAPTGFRNIVGGNKEDQCSRL